MAETKREEHERQQHRTDELKKTHADLALDRTPFNQADHDRHTKICASTSAISPSTRRDADEGH